ncbi:MAG TPA: putative Ig domain-containing protein, partial [Acidimicrobiales bacterium]|nr:putative Ig domain-containing protein [Acidimicrobiales bacterium]
MCASALVLTFVGLPFVAASADPPALLTQCDQPSLLAAIADLGGSGSVQFDCLGSITFDSPVLVTADQNLTLDASEIGGVSLSGGRATQLFQVDSGGTLTLDDVSLTDGLVQGSLGNGGAGGGLGNQGNDGLTGTDANQTSYGVVFPGGGGGAAGDGSQGSSGGNGSDGQAAEGGAIYAAAGSVVAVNGGTFSDNTAIGGDGGDAGDGGGGGPGGNGGTGGAGGTAAPTFQADGGRGGYGGAGGNGGDGGAGGNGGNGGGASGGAIYSDGSLSLSNVTFRGNSASGGAGGAGGEGGAAGTGGIGGAGGPGGGASSGGTAPAGTGGDGGAPGAPGAVGNPGDAGTGGNGGDADGGAVSGTGDLQISETTFTDNGVTGGGGGPGGGGAPAAFGNGGPAGQVGGPPGQCWTCGLTVGLDTNRGTGGAGGDGAKGSDASDGGDGGTGGDGGHGFGGALESTTSLTLDNGSAFSANNAWGGLGGVGGTGANGGTGGAGGSGGGGAGFWYLATGSNPYYSYGQAGNAGDGGDGGDAGDGGDGGDSGGGGASMGGALWATGAFTTDTSVSFSGDVSHGAPDVDGGPGGTHGTGGAGGPAGVPGGYQTPAAGQAGNIGTNGQDGANDGGAGAPGNLGIGTYDESYSAATSPLSAAGGTFAAVVGTPYSAQLSATNGVAPLTWQVVAPSVLPPGLTLSHTGELSGTPSTPGSFRTEVEVVDSSVPDQVAGATVLIEVSRPLTSIGAAELVGVVGGNFEGALGVSGGVPPYSWTLTSGTFPPGLYLQPDGQLSGQPSAAGTYTFSAQVTDSSVAPVTATVGPVQVTIAPVPLQVVTTYLPDAVNGLHYSAPIQVVGGTGPYTFSPVFNALPTGLSMDAQGIVSGTPDADSPGGQAGIEFLVTDAAGQEIGGAVGITSQPAGTLAITSTPPNVVIGAPYSYTPSAAGGTGPYTWSQCGILDQGLTFDPNTGSVTGTPTSSQDLDAGCIQVTDSAASPASSPQDLPTVVDQVTTNGVSPDYGYADGPFTGWLTAGGGTAPYTYSIVSGNLPDGLQLNPDTGEITGDPTATDSSTITYQVTDALGSVATGTDTLSVYDPVSLYVPTTVHAVTGHRLSQAAYAADANGLVLSYSATGLPSGVGIDPSSGLITGRPSQAGAFSATLTASDGEQSATTTVQVVVVDADAPTFLSPQAGGVSEGQPFTLAVNATGSPTPTVTESGALPAGLTFNGYGLTGTAGASSTGTYHLTFTATNSLGSATQNFTLTVGSPPTFTSPAGVSVTPGHPVAFTVRTTGDPVPAVSESGALPPGLTFTPGSNGTATIAGTVPVGDLGPFPVVIVTAGNGVGTTTQNLAFTVVTAPPGGTITLGKATSLIGNYPEQV